MIRNVHFLILFFSLIHAYPNKNLSFHLVIFLCSFFFFLMIYLVYMTILYFDGVLSIVSSDN